VHWFWIVRIWIREVNALWTSGREKELAKVTGFWRWHKKVLEAIFATCNSTELDKALSMVLVSGVCAANIKHDKAV